MYFVNLLRPFVVAEKYTDEDYESDLEDHGDTLQDWDFHVFTEYRKAQDFVSRYKKTQAELKTKGAENAPHLIYKRRYLVLTAMGIKLKTVRSYDKGWSPGTVFNLYDQTYYVPVMLREIRKTDDDEYTYFFDLA